MFKDPARPPDNWTSAQAAYRGIEGHQIHYVNNGMGFSAPGIYNGTKSMTRVEWVKSAGDVMYLSDFAADPLGDRFNQAHSAFPLGDFSIAVYYDLREPGTIMGNSSQLRIDPERHSGGANVLFHDGHAANRRASVLRKVAAWDDGDHNWRFR
jgi:prepilin-type processing-associated H-X9-DG protein